MAKFKMLPNGTVIEDLIEENVDLSGYYTKSEVNSIINNIKVAHLDMIYPIGAVAFGACPTEGTWEELEQEDDAAIDAWIRTA